MFETILFLTGAMIVLSTVAAIYRPVPVTDPFQG